MTDGDCEQCGSATGGEHSLCDACWSSGVWRVTDREEQEEARELLEIGRGIENYYSKETDI